MNTRKISELNNMRQLNMNLAQNRMENSADHKCPLLSVWYARRGMKLLIIKPSAIAPQDFYICKVICTRLRC